MNQTIIKLTINQEQDYVESSFAKYWPLEIFTKKSAMIINQVIHNIVANCEFKFRNHRYYDTYDASAKKGGGFIRAAAPDVTVNEFGKIGLLLYNTSSLQTYLRASDSHTEKLASIMDKLGNEFKKYWRSHFVSADGEEENGILDIRTNPRSSSSEVLYHVTYDEYRVLYEFLKGRDKEKTIRNYGQTTYDEMIGKPINNQFVVTALMSLAEEQRKLKEEWSKKQDELRNICDQEIKDANAKYRTANSVLEEEYKAKIAELENQAAEMKKMNDVAESVAAD